MRERKTPPSGLIEEISDARVKSARRTSQDTENKPVLPDQPTPTSGNHEQGFLELQKERLLAHEARCQKRSWYPLTDITLGLFRLGVSDPAVRDLATEMKKGNIPDAFRGVLVTNHDGVVCVNLEVLANPGSSEISEIRKIPGAIDLLRVLDRDLTLAGGDSMDSKRFRDGRERTTHTSHQKMLAYMKKEADLMYELVDDTKIPFEDEQQKEDYERIQEKVEEVVKRLFLASGLTHVRPDVHITRSTSMNAFVWGLGREDVAKDIFSSLQSERVVALPIYIHLGLLQRFTTVDELAGVLAHEFSHLLQPEYAHEKDKSQIQRLEYDADKQAMHLADVAGYNPRGLLDAFSYFSQEGFSSFGTETHPDRQYRIIEMEKYFHRSDIPFPNGQKKAESFSPAYRESLGRVSVEKKSGHISFGMESIASALETVRSAPSEDFLHDRSWNEDILKKTGEKFLKDILTDQEFIHDSFGCRTRLVNSLNNFFHLLAIADASASDEHTFKVHLPRLRSHIDKVPSEDLPLSFSHIRDDADRSALVVSQEEVIKKEQELLERCRGLGIQPSVAIESLDDLLDDDHPSAKLFWPHVPNLFGEPLNTRLEKRAYLQQLLSVDINGYGDRINAINISESVIVSRHTVKETKKREPSSSDQKPGVLARAPLAFRAHRRGQQEEPTEEVDVERVQWKQSDHIFSTNGLARGIVSFALLSESPDKQAPAVQEFAQVIEERTVDAFSEFVGEKPSSDVSLFLMQNLVGSQILFQRGEEMSISFVDTARRALEQRLLQNKRSGFIASNKQISLRNQLCTLLAFGLIPQDDHEQAIQTEALLRIQDDPFVVREQPCIVRGIGDELPKGVDAQYVKKSGGDLFLSDRANRFSALGNQMWQTYGEEMEHLLDGGRFIAQIVPPEMRELKIREIDLKHAESKLNEDEARGLFEDTTESAWQERATILARFAAGYRSYMEVMYREVLPTTRDVVAVDTEERKLRKNGRERKFREPYTFLPFLDACVKMLMPYTKKEVSNDQIRGLVMRMFDKAVSPYDANRRLRLVHDLAGIREDETASLFAEYSFDYSGDVGTQGFGMYWSRRKEVHYTNKINCGSADMKREWLTTLALDNPKADRLLSAVSRRQESGYSDMSQVLDLASFGYFVHFSMTTINKKTPENVAQIIEIYRAATELYGDEWSHIESFKRFDEQLAHWEWVYANPVITTRVDNNGERVADSKKALKEPKKKGLKDFGMMDVWFFPDTLTKKLRKKYQIDTQGVDSGSIFFSWPLFIQDVWGDNIDFGDEQLDTWARLVRDEIHRVVDDPETLDRVKGMQPGFFREFFLAKKMEALGVSSLDDLEPWMPYFTSRPHEASERNQIVSQIQARTYSVRKDTKETLFRRAIASVIPDQIMDEVMKEVRGFEDSYNGADLNEDGMYMPSSIALRVAIDKIVERYKKGEGDEHYKKMVKENERVYDYVDTLLTGDAIKRIYETYKNLLDARVGEAVEKGKQSPDEAEVKVFSDHVVEDAESRLEIGPVYRLRLITQPLMDWHSRMLRDATSPADVASLIKRVKENIPDKHPLRDIFLQNQLSVEIWHTLVAEVGEEKLSELGVRLEQKDIDLKTVLKDFPLYADISFLKTYSLFSLHGLASCVSRLPTECMERILNRLEQVMDDDISTDQRPVLRRFLMDMERSIRWKTLKKNRVNDPSVFDTYIERICTLYPDPTHERDDLLETIGMDLAYTKEQISRVWQLRYAEQVRLPGEKEKKSTGQQHDATEKLRGMLSMRDRVDRSAYLLWMIGDTMPLTEALTPLTTSLCVDDRKQAFWRLSPTERRSILYDTLLGEHGVLEDYSLSWSSPSSSRLQPFPWKTATSEYMMKHHFSDRMFGVAFGDQLLDPNLPDMHDTNTRGKELLSIVFRELIAQQPKSSRRAELVANIIEAMGKTKQDGKDMTAGQMIRLLLEQIGVVGIKAAQILSEQPGLLPTGIQHELEQLKDGALPFSKRAVNTYTQSAGYMSNQGQQVSTIEDTLGSASIKQVNRGRLGDGTEVAIKAKRPSIDKSFEDDILVLAGVVKKVQEAGFDVPSYLLTEVERAIRGELHFPHEVDNQLAMKRMLESRHASIEWHIDEAKMRIPLVVNSPLEIGEVLYPDEGSAYDSGIIIEEFVRGLSLKELQTYQHAVQSDDSDVMQTLREKISRQYGAENVERVEQVVRHVDISTLQASLGMELLRQVVSGGVFHADLHAGNFYLDFGAEADGSDARAVFIDLGSTGASFGETAPAHIKDSVGESFDAREDFKDFLSSLFSVSGHPETIARIVNTYTGLSWNEEYVQEISEGESLQTGEKVKKILYRVLEDGGEKIHEQFRLFLKAVATGAGHFDALKEVLSRELSQMMSGDGDQNIYIPRVLEESLLNIDLIST